MVNGLCVCTLHGRRVCCMGLREHEWLQDSEYAQTASITNVHIYERVFNS